MEIRRCEKGHFYDAEINGTCPQCEADKKRGIDNSGLEETQDVFEKYGTTEPFDASASDAGGMGMGETEAVNSGFTDINFGPVHPEVEDYDSVTQPVTINGQPGFSPVTGWLVCIDGPARGTDYRVKAGYNYIGRSEHMDIFIQGDMKIGRERHALVAYDDEEKMFFFGPADGKSIVRLNGKPVLSPMQLNPYDTLTIGSTKLMFVPLCGERFDWNE